MRAELTLPERPAAVHLLAVLDVLVLLLVFFVLLTSIAQEAGISVRLPESGFRLMSYGKPIVVTARGGAMPVVYVDQKDVTMKELAATLENRAEETGAETMVLFADEMLPYGMATAIVEIGLKLGLNVAQAGRQGGEEASGDAPEASSVPVAPETNEKTEP